jgi:dTDP-4-dehydrorhamnose reductase
LVRAASEKHDVQQLTRDHLRVQDSNALTELLSSFSPDWVINTAAFHKLYECEMFPDEARAVNELGATNVANVSEQIGAKVAYISTDYVFDGLIESNLSYKPDDERNPLNVYGLTKLRGEDATLQDGRNIVFRISSAFGVAGSHAKGGNFLETIIDKARKGQTITVPRDNRMSPTYTQSASRRILNLISEDRSGIHHVSNDGSCSWFDLAEFTLKTMGIHSDLRGRESPLDEEPRRPLISTLCTQESPGFGLYEFTWQAGVEAYLKEKGYL